MKKVLVLAVIICMISAVNFSSADNIRGINIDFVTIGHPGNAGDTRTGVDQNGRALARPFGCGAVAYTYRIAKFELTNAQWDLFVSLAGAPAGTGGGYDTGSYYLGAQKPVGAVTWNEEAQFCNWLTSGDKSKGAYLFSGNNANAGAFLGIDREAAKATYGTIYVIPTESEWYKAAYFKAEPNVFSQYANGTNVAPPIKGAESNWGWGYAGMGVPWNVGTGLQEQNGTYDMMGNFWEWTETIFVDSSQNVYRVLRGGAFFNPDAYLISTTGFTDMFPYVENTTFTPRIVELAPCPTPLAGDLNGDCKVNFFDYAVFANAYIGVTNDWLSLMDIADTWLQCGKANPADCWQ
jgi:formylglycine-generating enzyme